MALAAAVLPGLVVFHFDRFEAWADTMGIGGGPSALAFVVLAFVLAWLPGAGFLAAWSPNPRREGLLAGGLVAVEMATVLMFAAAHGDDWLIVVSLLPLFGGLALASGAAIGALGAGARRRAWI